MRDRGTYEEPDNGESYWHWGRCGLSKFDAVAALSFGSI